MSNLNLDAMSLAELKQLQKDVAKAIATFQERQRAEARSKVEAIAREMGFSLDELLGAEPKGKRGRKPVTAGRYRNPGNPSQTWSGRGRRPGWFTDALAAGTSGESMRIG